ncbi:Hf [Drosophila busckii]|uniref:Hf n=1 Tax=Drosophila busckii TaxID=30019 RepID=A0A0M4ESZ9_DROBS|nr:Hf [Drosophila busckii]
MSSAKTFQWLISVSCLISLCFCFPGSTTLVNETTQTLEQDYKQVLQSTITDYYQKRMQSNSSNAIDLEYFTDLDQGYDYQRAYFLFTLINLELIRDEAPDSLLLEVLPDEKLSIRNFYIKAEQVIENYLRASNQSKSDLMQYLKRGKTETDNSLVKDFLKFSEELNKHLPELVEATKQKSL